MTEPRKPALNALLLIWWLFAMWAASTYGVKVLLLVIYEVGGKIPTDILDHDFINYWLAGKAVIRGETAFLFDHQAYYEHLKLIFGADSPIRSWSYPPHFLLLVAPLGALDFRPALVAFLLVTFVLFAYFAREFVKRVAPDMRLGALLLATTGYVLMMILSGQNGFLTAAMLLCVFAFMRERPIVAGFALALLTMKPQLGFLIPLLALLDRNWALLRWASIFTAALVGISVLLFGVESWRGYFADSIPFQGEVMRNWDGRFIYMMPSVFGSMRALGFLPQAAFAAQLVVSIAAFAALVVLLRRLVDPLERAFALLTATFLITPYAFYYDLGALSVVAACMAWRAYATGHRAAAVVFAVLAALPAEIEYLGWFVKAPISPLVLCGALLALHLSNRQDGPRPATVRA
jgi:glycosyl transferase family 87